MKKIKMKKKGMALVLAISVVFILLFVGIILVLLAKRETGLTISLKNRKEAFSYAETGADRAYSTLRYFGVHSTDFGNPDDPNDKGYKIDFEEGWITKKGYHTTIKYLGIHRPASGYQVGPKFLGGGRFEGFYYHVQSEGFKDNTRRVIHLTIERIFPIE